MTLSLPSPGSPLACRPRVDLLDLCAPRTNSEDMTNHAVDSSRPLLTLGRVDLVRVLVGYRSSPDDWAYQQFLLDLTVPGGE